MRITYFGHSCFLIEVEGARLVIDPYLSANPHGKVDPRDVPCELVLCTHAHDDHILDAPALSTLHGATLVAPYELAEHFSSLGLRTLDLMPGGGIDFPWGRILMTPAVHSSSLDLPGGGTRAMGVPSGFVVSAEGKSVYHAGDTALFGDMRLIGRQGLDVALIPIGDRYTMGPGDAVESLGLLQPKLAIPMHFGTTPKIMADPAAFASEATEQGHVVRVLKAGDTLQV